MIAYAHQVDLSTSVKRKLNKVFGRVSFYPSDFMSVQGGLGDARSYLAKYLYLSTSVALVLTKDVLSIPICFSLGYNVCAIKGDKPPGKIIKLSRTAIRLIGGREWQFNGVQSETYDLLPDFQKPYVNSLHDDGRQVSDEQGFREIVKLRKDNDFGFACVRNILTIEEWLDSIVSHASPYDTIGIHNFITLLSPHMFCFPDMSISVNISGNILEMLCGIGVNPFHHFDNSYAYDSLSGVSSSNCSPCHSGYPDRVIHNIAAICATRFHGVVSQSGLQASRSVKESDKAVSHCTITINGNVNKPNESTLIRIEELREGSFPGISTFIPKGNSVVIHGVLGFRTIPRYAMNRVFYDSSRGIDVVDHELKSMVKTHDIDGLPMITDQGQPIRSSIFYSLQIPCDAEYRFSEGIRSYTCDEWAMILKFNMCGLPKWLTGLLDSFSGIRKPYGFVTVAYIQGSVFSNLVHRYVSTSTLSIYDKLDLQRHDSIAIRYECYKEVSGDTGATLEDNVIRSSKGAVVDVSGHLISMIFADSYGLVDINRFLDIISLNVAYHTNRERYNLSVIYDKYMEAFEYVEQGNKTLWHTEDEYLAAIMVAQMILQMAGGNYESSNFKFLIKRIKNMYSHDISEFLNNMHIPKNKNIIFCPSHSGKSYYVEHTGKAFDGDVMTRERGQTSLFRNCSSIIIAPTASFSLRQIWLGMSLDVPALQKPILANYGRELPKYVVVLPVEEHLKLYKIGFAKRDVTFSESFVHSNRKQTLDMAEMYGIPIFESIDAAVEAWAKDKSD